MLFTQTKKSSKAAGRVTRLIAGIAAILLMRLVQHKLPSSKTGLVVKGFGDALFIAAKRGINNFTLKPLDHLKEGATQ